MQCSVIKPAIESQTISNDSGYGLLNSELNPKYTEIPTPKLLQPNTMSDFFCGKKTLCGTLLAVTTGFFVYLMPRLFNRGEINSATGLNNKIVGGSNVSHYEYPEIVRVGYQESKNLLNYEYPCGGTWININGSFTVVTTATCLFNNIYFKSENFVVQSIIDSNETIVLPVDEIAFHPNFSRELKSFWYYDEPAIKDIHNDVALLLFNFSAIDSFNITAMEVYNKDPKPGQSMLALGFGADFKKDSRNLYYPNQLRYGSMTAISKNSSTFKQLFSEEASRNDGISCARPDTNSETKGMPIYGDFGSPYMTQDRKLVGPISIVRLPYSDSRDNPGIVNWPEKEKIQCSTILYRSYDWVAGILIRNNSNETITATNETITATSTPSIGNSVPTTLLMTILSIAMGIITAVILGFVYQKCRANSEESSPQELTTDKVELTKLV